MNSKLHEVMCAVVETLYRGNLAPSNHLHSQAILTARLQLSSRLHKWRIDCSTFCDIIVDHDLSTLLTPATDLARYSVLLSIAYYRVGLLINGPVVSELLLHASKIEGDVVEALRQPEESIPAVKDGFAMAKALHALIRNLCLQIEPFFDHNMAWWMCNYASE